jgi:hypothetical protein
VSTSALLSLAAAVISLAGTPVAPRLSAGIPVSGAPQQWGVAVLETLRDSASLDTIRVEDVARGSTVSTGSASSTASALGRAQLGATYSATDQSIAPFIQRELKRVWRLTVPAMARNTSMLRVTTTIESLHGEPGRLSLIGHEEISIPVIVLERSPTVRTENAGSRIMEGGVILQIPSASLQLAGQYGGRIVLRTEGF